MKCSTETGFVSIGGFMEISKVFHGKSLRVYYERLMNGLTPFLSINRSFTVPKDDGFDFYQYDNIV